MSGHCSSCGETGGCDCSEIKEQKFWISVDNDQSVGSCLVTDGDSIQYAYFNGDVYLGCSFRQRDIIAWFPCTHPPVPGELMTPEQHAILLMDERLRKIERKLESKTNKLRLQDHEEKKSKILRN